MPEIPPTVLTQGALSRLVVVLGLTGALWLAVLWALS